MQHSIYCIAKPFSVSNVADSALAIHGLIDDLAHRRSDGSILASGPFSGSQWRVLLLNYMASICC
jgi:hypothetical protein